MSGSIALWLSIGVAALLIGLLAYWQLVIAEGTYLGQRLVTWLYDLTADRYDHIKQFQPAMEDHFLGEPLASRLAGGPAPFLLDIATGTARLPLALFSQPGFQGHIVGLDASRRMLAVAARKTADVAHRFHLIWREAACLPFADGAFDAVTCLEMLEFTPDPERQLVEAVRVLRGGGIFLTSRRKGFDAALMPARTHDPESFHALLETNRLCHIRIEPWQADYDLDWAWKEGESPGKGIYPLSEILRCPHCNRVGFADHGVQWVCLQCGAAYPFRDGILDMHA